jgi:propanol-preferring alcohol dehydrogenase
MRAMVLPGPGLPLRLESRPEPKPGPGELRIEVRACGVCRTDLHIARGELGPAPAGLVLGHQIVGRVLECGPEVRGRALGERVGLPWLGGACGACRHCRRWRENLCHDARFTGLSRDGGFAEQVVADARFCFPLPEGGADRELAPLLCAGVIGHRALRLGGDGRHVGLFGFGSAAHQVAQVLRWEGRDFYAFTRPGDVEAQDRARAAGAAWAGGSDEPPPVPLDLALIFAPVGSLVPRALEAVDEGGTVVLAGIHMSEVPAMPYRTLWGERTLRSVANLARTDVESYLSLAPRIPIRTDVACFPLESAQDALDALASGALDRASAVLEIAPSSDA